MAKFGDLINTNVPVLLFFYRGKGDGLDSTLEDLVSIYEEQVKVVRIDIDKNLNLVTALRINAKESYILYKDNEMKWRQNGKISSIQLIKKLKEFV